MRLNCLVNAVGVRPQLLPFIYRWSIPDPPLFGSPATSLKKRPVALRPRLTTGLPLSQRFRRMRLPYFEHERERSSCQALQGTC